MGRVLLVVVLLLGVNVGGCGLLDGGPAAPPSVSVVQHPDGTITVSEIAPWWAGPVVTLSSTIVGLLSAFLLGVRPQPVAASRRDPR